jgi:type II secretory pathway component PulM
VRLPFDVGALWARVLAWYNGYSERDRRIILGIVVALGLSVVYLGIVEPILDYRKDVARRIADDQEQLERAMRMVGAKDSLRAEREDLRRRLTQAKSRLLPGGTATLGAAALQERANALASEKGIAVQSTQVMKEEVLEPFRKVAVRLTLSGELKPLADLLSGVEYGQQLNIPFVEVSRRGAVAGAKGPRTLSVTVEVSGFVQGTAPAKSEGGEGEPAPTVEAQAETAPGELGGPAQIGDAPPGDVPPARPEGTPAGTPAAGTPPPTTAEGAAAAATPTTLVPTGTTVPPSGAEPAAGASTTIVSTTLAPMTLPPMVFPTTAPRTVPPAGSPPPRGAGQPPAAPPPPPAPADDADEDGE